MPLYSVSNYAMPNLVPCIVVGFHDVHARAHDDFVTVDVQAGGLSCLQERATGFVLRLAAAGEFARIDPWPLVRAFQNISDDETHSDGPSDDVAMVGNTSGESFTPDVLAELDGVLAKYFRLPPLVAGIEAFARFDVVDALAFLEDWPVWTLAPRDGPAEATYIDDDGSIARFQTADVERLGRAHVERLQRLAAELSLDQPVRAFLVWGNSD